MCLLFALTSTAGMRKVEVETLIHLVQGEFRQSQKDGFGFALQGGNTQTLQSERHVERYVSPSDFLGPGRMPRIVQESGWLGRFASISAWEQSGDWDQFNPSGPLIAHGRTSTGRVEIANTHPFTKLGWTLAHNGVVDWYGAKLPLDTTCDSEHLLNCYTHLDGVRSFADNLTGWFATLAIDPAGRLHVAKCAATDLYFAWCGTWKTYILSTRQTMIHKVVETLKQSISRPLPLAPYTEIVFDGNDCHGTVDFEAPDTRSALTSLANRALGKRVDGDDSAAGFTVKGGRKSSQSELAALEAEESEEEEEEEDLQIDDELDPEDESDEARDYLIDTLSSHGCVLDNPDDLSAKDMTAMLRALRRSQMTV